MADASTPPAAPLGPIQNADGSWSYPPSFTPEHRVRFEHSHGELAATTKALDAAVAGSAAALASPDALIAEAQARVAEAKRTVDRLRRATAGQLAWVQASIAHGADVARLDSEEGDVIIQLYMAPAEIDAANAAANRLLAAAQANVAPNADQKTRDAAHAIGLHDHQAKHLDLVLAKCTVGGLGPDESRERLKYLVKRYAGIGVMLTKIRDELVMGFRVREEKDFAP